MSETNEVTPASSRAIGARVLAIGVVWLVLLRVFLDNLALWLPRDVVKIFTLDTYVATIQVVVTAMGVGLVAIAMPSIKSALPFPKPTPRQIATAAGLAPIVFIFGLAIGIAIALPTLIAEIEARGTDAGRQNLGELGRVLRESPLVITLLWTVVIAPITEELLFRGALWSGLQSLIAPSSKPAPASNDAPPSSALDALPMDDGPLVKASRAAASWLREGGIATLVTAAIFGAMHADTPGGAGIIRVVSATFLGLIAGVLRQRTGGLLFGIALHMTYNLFSVGHSRSWWISETFPSRFGIPTLVAVIALISAIALVIARVVLGAPKREVGA